MDGGVFGEARTVFKAADLEIGCRVLQQECDVLIGTLNSFGRQDVLGSCPIDTIIIDECSQATLGDIAIPFATLADTVVRVIASGDDLQLPGYWGSVRSNEVGLYVSASIFRGFRRSDEFDNYLHNVQYRCHSRIYRWSNDTIYEGKVTTFGKNDAITDVDRTVSSFMLKQIGHVQDKNGKVMWSKHARGWPRVIAVDMNYPSRPYPGSASSWNPQEVEFMVWLRKALLDAPAPPGGRALTPNDITVISPYRGEVKAMSARVKDEGIVSTVAKAQGGECLVGISSFAKNEPDRPQAVGFVSLPANLNVWFTRQKRFHFVLGNWTARHANAEQLRRANQGNKTYIKLLEHVCGPDNKDGVLVVQPRHFMDWRGFPRSASSASTTPASD